MHSTGQFKHACIPLVKCTYALVYVKCTCTCTIQILWSTAHLVYMYSTCEVIIQLDSSVNIHIHVH